MVHAVDFGQARLGGLIGRVYPRKHRTDLPRLRIVQARPPRASFGTVSHIHAVFRKT
jgi:hypothetical protein